MPLQSFKAVIVISQGVTFPETEIPFFSRKENIYLCHFSPNVQM